MTSMYRVIPLAATAFLLFVAGVSSAAVSIPADTRVYLETKEPLIGKKEQVSVGQMVQCQVWRDVVVDGQVVIAAGAPALAKVDSFKTRKIAGIKGKMTLAALETQTIDQQTLPLDGGYHKEGKGRIALSAALAAVVALPLIFIPGKPAELPVGTVFDAYTANQIAVVTSDDRPPVIDLSGMVPDFEVEVLYDELEKEDKPKEFHFLITAPTDAPETFVIDRINGEPTDPIPLEVASVSRQEDNVSLRASTNIKKLVKRFTKGINTMEFAYFEEPGNERRATEVVLDIQF